MAEAAETSPLVHYRDVAFMGILPVLRHLSTIRRAGRRIQQAMLEFRPDVVIPVDFAGFNFEYILPFVRRHLPDTRLVYYIAPKLWAWKSWRIRTLRRYVDELLVILPFEQEYFSGRGVKTTFVGNPCVDATRAIRSEAVAPREQIALLAGSRRQELASNLTTMLRAVAPLGDRYHIVIAGAPGLTLADYAPYLDGQAAAVELRFADTYRIVAESRAALVTSGTATLEVALIGTPEVVLYRMGGQRLARWVFDTLFRVPYISLVNLILGRAAVPELIGHEVSPERVYRTLLPLLEDGAVRQAQLESIEALRAALGSESTSRLAARAILRHFDSKA